jgi:hypothetical protein
MGSAAAMSNASTPRDALRQSINVAGAVGQVLATFYVVRAGTVDYFNEPTAGGEVPIIPAGYAFSVWGLIYAGSLAYAVYQALPVNRERPLLRRIGFATAIAFAATTGWLIVAQRPERVWGTVALIVVITGALASAFRELVRAERPAPFTATERYLVVAPISVFLGWVSVATFANTASALRYSEITAPGRAESALSAVMIAAAAGAASWATAASRGNAWYGGTVLWALVGIAVANVVRQPNALVAAVATLAAGGVLAALLTARRRTPRGRS